MVISDDICIAILWLVHFHVGVLPGKLLARIDGLSEDRRKRSRKQTAGRQRQNDDEKETERWEGGQKHKRILEFYVGREMEGKLLCCRSASRGELRTAKTFLPENTVYPQHVSEDSSSSWKNRHNAAYPAAAAPGLSG